MPIFYQAFCGVGRWGRLNLFFLIFAYRNSLSALKDIFDLKVNRIQAFLQLSFIPLYTKHRSLFIYLFCVYPFTNILYNNPPWIYYLRVVENQAFLESQLQRQSNSPVSLLIMWRKKWQRLLPDETGSLGERFRSFALQATSDYLHINRKIISSLYNAHRTVLRTLLPLIKIKEVWPKK